MAFGILARRLGAGAWLLACVALLAGCAEPAPTARLGSVHEGSVALGSRMVPLPPGRWTVQSETTTASAVHAGSSFTIRRIQLVQHVNGRPTAIIHARTSEGQVHGQQFPIGPVRACQASADNLRPVLFKLGEVYYDCRRVFLTGPNITRSGPIAPGWPVVGQEPPIIVPTVLFAVADRTGQLHVDALFNPETRGLPRDTRDWEQNAWNAANRTRLHLAYIDHLVAWAEAAHPAIRDGLSGLAPAPLPAF